MNPGRTGRLLISDMAEGRVWEAEKSLALARYRNRDGSTFVAPTQEAVFEDMRSTLPPVIRRSPQERLRATMQPIVEQALTAYKATGHITWPRSAERALADIARLKNDPTLLNDGGVDQVIRQGIALAQHIAETGEMQQKAQDHKKVTLDWAGH